MKEFAYIHDDGDVPASLRAVPLLSSFNEEQLDDVLNSSSLIDCDKGDVVIQEGTIDSRLYILLSGELDVCVGGKRFASISRAGEVFGELALVNQDRRAASVIAANRAVCLAVDQKFLQDLRPRDQDPEFHAALYEFVARLIARKLEATSRRVAELEKELRELKGQPAEETESRPPAKGRKAPTSSSKSPRRSPR
ncbi:MAG: cyclic nucleotide-binding domain-containing protein [Verrucomicrobiales bacterium]|nr:cyclic nucleotide-binding domain-containing protein [Verrucomicrobiales bacterium]